MEKLSLQFREQSVQSILQVGENNFVQLSLEPGQELPIHRAPSHLSIVVLTGRILFAVSDQSEFLDASEMLTLGPNVEHAIKAIEQSTVLLILTPDGAINGKSVSATNLACEHENAFQHPELLELVAPEIRPLVEDHIQICQVLQSVTPIADSAIIRLVLSTVKRELDHHFVAEEKVLFPRLAGHVGGMDVGPVARMLEEHQEIRRLYQEAESLKSSDDNSRDEHVKLLLSNKIIELSSALLNHLGKEDSHLFPMASQLLTEDEKAAVANELGEFLSTAR